MLRISLKLKRPGFERDASYDLDGIHASSLDILHGFIAELVMGPLWSMTFSLWTLVYLCFGGFPLKLYVEPRRT